MTKKPKTNCASPPMAGNGKAAAAARRKMFIQAYIANGHNATEAAKTAGFSARTAYSQGQRLLKNVEVARELAAAAKEAEKFIGMKVEDTLREIGRIGRFNRRKLYHPDGTEKKPHEWDDDTAAAISHISSNGAVPFDKNTALNMVMKHQGLYERDNAQRSENLSLKVVLVK